MSLTLDEEAAAMTKPDTAVVVTQLTLEAQGVVSVRLASPDGQVLEGWLPGAHIDLILPDGIVRQYSLCGDPQDTSSWRIAVLREPNSRGGSAYVHDLLRVGQIVGTQGPRNNFVFEPGQRTLFIAGGIGITPLLPMMAEAERRGARWRLLYGGRRLASMAFLDELSAYGSRVVVSPEDRDGLLDLTGWLGEPDDGTKVYCCGPEPLLQAVESVCSAWPDDALRVERFAARADVPRDAAADGAFTVVCSKSNRTLTVPADKSVLDVMNEAGMGWPSSCEDGICGTCEVRVSRGEVDHRDSVLSAAERARNTSMLVCVSRALSSEIEIEA